MKITELAPEHIARFDEWVQKWTQIGRSMEPVDFDLAIESVLELYGLAKLNKPLIILRMGCPLGAVIGGSVGVHCLQELKKIAPDRPSDDALAQVVNAALAPFGNLVSSEIRKQVMEQIAAQISDDVKTNIWAGINAQVGYQDRRLFLCEDLAQVRTQVSNQVRWQVLDQVKHRVYRQFSNGNGCWEHLWYRLQRLLMTQFGLDGRHPPSARARDRIMSNYMEPLIHATHDLSWLAYVSFFGDVVGLENSVFEKTRIYENIAVSCGYLWLHENVLVLSDRPEQYHLDAMGRLHNDRGPSFSFRDGWRQYHRHGVAIPGEWVTGSPPSVEEALTWGNIEQRRVAIEMIGWKNILKELDPKVIDEDGDPEIGTLFEAELPGVRGRTSLERFLKVRCGTGREFVLPVPPQVNTALEANAWTWGLEAYEYRPEART